MGLINVERSNDFKYVIIFKLIADNLLSELRITNLGNELSFDIGVHFEAKNSLKSLAFSLKLATSLLPTFSGGINGIFYHYRKFSG